MVKCATFLICWYIELYFQMWQFAPNSLHYLLSLWQRMVASMPYVKNTEPHLLESYAPEVRLSVLLLYTLLLYWS